MRNYQVVLTALALGALALPAAADDAPGYFKVPGTDTTLQVYGNACFDVAYDTVQGGGILTGLSAASASTPDNAMPKNQWDMSMAESRFGVRTLTPSEFGDVKTRFEMDFLGTNKDKAGVPNTGETKNYAHVRQMYGEMCGFLAGKTDSNFEDPDGSPNYLDWDGLLADWYGVSRIGQLRYTTELNKKTVLSVAVEQDSALNIGGNNPRVTTANKGTTTMKNDLPGAFTARLQYADQWGHISFAGAFARYSQLAVVPYTPAQTAPASAAVPGSTGQSSKNTFSWAVAGHFQFGPDSFVYHFGMGDGQNGAGLQDGVVWGTDGQLHDIQAKQFEAGYEHFWTPKLHTNLFLSLVDYKRDANEGLTGGAFSSYQQYGGNIIWNATKTAQFGAEYIYGVAKTFDQGTIVNPDLTTTDAIHESKLHFQFKYKFF